MKRAAWFVLAFLLFHSPEGAPLWIACQAVFTIRPIGDVTKQHVATGTRALIYTPGHTLAVKEAADDAVAKANGCAAPGDDD
jgi:hypothetical protein